MLFNTGKVQTHNDEGEILVIKYTIKENGTTIRAATLKFRYSSGHILITHSSHTVHLHTNPEMNLKC
jgi:hypothetical protein